MKFDSNLIDTFKKKSSIFILILTFCGSGLQIIGQEIKSPLHQRNLCPTIIINNLVISNMDFVVANETKVKKVSVLYGPTDEIKERYDFAESGVVFVELDFKPTIQTQEKVNIINDLPQNNPIYVNGNLLKSKEFVFASESIIQIETLYVEKENQLKQRVLNIWTLTAEERINGCSKGTREE